MGEGLGEGVGEGVPIGRRRESSSSVSVEVQLYSCEMFGSCERRRERLEEVGDAKTRVLSGVECKDDGVDRAEGTSGVWDLLGGH
jgi:hypothetical protein